MVSDYERRYHVSVGYLNYYTDSPVEALRVYNGYMKPDDYNVMPKGGIWEGHAEESYFDGSLYRKNTAPILPSTLEYLIQRAAVQKMLEEIR